VNKELFFIVCAAARFSGSLERLRRPRRATTPRPRRPIGPLLMRITSSRLFPAETSRGWCCVIGVLVTPGKAPQCSHGQGRRVARAVVLLSTHKSPNYPSYFNYILNARIK